MAHWIPFPAETSRADSQVIPLRVTIGGTGAPTAESSSVTGYSVARTGTGTYVATFADRPYTFLFGIGSVLPGSGTDRWTVSPTAEFAPSGNITFTTYNGAGVAADPPNGSILMLLIWTAMTSGN